MKITYQVNQRTSVEFEATTHKEVVQALAGLNEILTNTKCGRCGKIAGHQFRQVGKHSYYEMKCSNDQCRAILPFGAHDNTEGTLFPKMYETDKKTEEKVYFNRYGG